MNEKLKEFHIEFLFSAILELKTMEECYKFFEDLCTVQELKATTVVGMAIEQASGKVRSKGVADEEEDYALPIYAARFPVRTVIGAAEPCPRMPAGVPYPEGLDGFAEGRRLVGFAGSVAHSPDIGGRIRSAEARDVFDGPVELVAPDAGYDI